jgi:predicted nuclease with TOPRIM domain
MKLDELYFTRQRGHSPSASLSKLSSSNVSPATPSPMAPSYIQHQHPDILSMADQLNTISSTTTTVLTTLQTLMRRSKDNAAELDNLRKQVLEAKEKDSETVEEIRRIVSSTTSTTDLTALYEKLDSLRPEPPARVPTPPPPIIVHKLDEEKEVVENILANANQALTHLLTLTESINTLTLHLQNTSTRLASEESQLETLVEKKSNLEAESARLEATIHLRNLELATFTKKADILESRILRAKTAVQLSGAKQVKMKKSPLIISPKAVSAATENRQRPATPLTPQRRILSLSSTGNKVSPVDATAGTRKSSWSKKLGGMLSGLTNSNNKENGGYHAVSKHGHVLESTRSKETAGLAVPVPRRERSVSERMKN